ncbi:MAG: carboxypeptidase regulatory-like domain-containing protein [Thermoleophilia bacterium]
MESPQHGWRSQEGFSFIEVLISILILAIVAGALFQGFATSSAQIGKARLDAVATKLAQGELEKVRNLDYGDLGLVGRNPPGTVVPSNTVTRSGTDYLIERTVEYVDDPAVGRPQTYVNYKKITVTVTPDVPVGQPVTETTVIAPPNFGNIAGKATAIVTVRDAVTNDVLSGVAVTINGSTSPTRVDSTDATGQVIFAGLSPSATSSSDPKYYYVVSANKSGYETHPDTPPSVTKEHLTASQTWNVTVKMYKPATINVELRDSSTGQLITERADVDITTPVPNSFTDTLTTYTGLINATTLSGNPIVPSASQFTVKASADCYSSSQQQSPVPVGYPANLVQNFTFNLTRYPCGSLDVWVKKASNNSALSGATVTVSGGPNGIASISRTSDSNGYVHFSLPAGSTTYTLSAAKSGYTTSTSQELVTNGTTTQVTKALSVAVYYNLRVRTSYSNRNIRVTGAGGFEAIQSTNWYGYTDFSLTAGTYSVQMQTGYSGGNPVWGSATTANVPADSQVWP